MEDGSLVTSVALIHTINLIRNTSRYKRPKLLDYVFPPDNLSSGQNSSVRVRVRVRVRKFYL